MPTILYPVLTEPVLPSALQPETVTESRWHQPFSTPVLRVALTAAVIATSSGIFWAPKAAPFPEAVTADRWVQPLSVPVLPGGLTTAAKTASGEVLVKAAPFPEAVTADRWFQPFSVPVWRFPVPGDSVFAPFVVTVAPVIGADSWYQPLSIPVRSPYAPPGHIALVQADPFPETVTADRWYQPFSVPLRKFYAPPTDIAPPLVVTVVPVVGADSWFQPFSVPVRQSYAPPGHIALVEAAPFPEVVNLSWSQPLSVPVRSPYAPPGHIALVETAPFAETATADRWSQPLSIPVRDLRGILAGEQQYLAFVEAAPFGETVTADRWFQPFSIPVRITYTPSADIAPPLFVAAVPTIGADSWYQPFSVPLRSSYVPSGQVAFIQAAPFGETVNLSWVQPLSTPVLPFGPTAALMAASGEIQTLLGDIQPSPPPPPPPPPPPAPTAAGGGLWWPDPWGEERYRERKAKRAERLDNLRREIGLIPAKPEVEAKIVEIVAKTASVIAATPARRPAAASIPREAKLFINKSVREEFVGTVGRDVLRVYEAAVAERLRERLARERAIRREDEELLLLLAIL